MKKRLVIWLVFSIISPLSAQAETIESPVFDPGVNDLAGFYFVIDKASFFDPENFFARLEIKNAAQSFNAVSLNFTFPPEKLSLSSTTINQDLCAFKILEKIDNVAGSYSLLCASDQPATSSEAKLVDLIFNKKDSGLSRLSIPPSSALYSADGLGTRLPIQPESHDVYLIKK